MSSAESDADIIRNRRLARLQALQQSTERPQSRDTSTSLASESARESPPAKSTDNTPQQRPFKDPHSGQPNLSPSASSSGPSSAQSENAAQHEGNDRLSPMEAWIDRSLSQIFMVALRPGPRTKDSGYRILESLRRDLEDDEQDEVRNGKKKKIAHLSLAVLDQLILSACADPKVVPINYLMGSWRRATLIMKNTPAGRLDEQKLSVLKEARRMCVSYILYCITMPDMFEGNQPEVRLEERLLMDPDDDRGLPQEVLRELAANLDEEPDLVNMFALCMERLSERLSALSMVDNYKPYVDALGRIVQVKSLAEIFVSLDKFLPSTCPTRPTPDTLEKMTLLGPFLRISPLQTPVSKTYFSAAKSRTAVAINDATRALRLTSRTFQDGLYQILNALVRTSEKARRRVLDFFAEALNANKKRAAMQVDRRTVASDGFMLNITGILNRMCEPFMDSSFSKIDRIDIDYFRHSPRLSITDETKLDADEQSATDFYSQQGPRMDNFITEVFFLTIAAHHYGLAATETRLENLSRDLPELERHLTTLEAERQKWLNTPQLSVLDRNIAMIRERIDEGIAGRYALEVMLLDDLSQSRTLSFMRYLTTWLLRVIDPTHKYPQAMIRLPLPGNPPEIFRHFPEYFIEDIGQCISFISQHLPRRVVAAQLEELLVFCITFLRMTSYIRRPSLKSKFVEIIFYGIQPYQGKAAGYLGDLIHGKAFALENLMHSLMNFYIEIEKQYYEKFTVRYHISHIIKAIWTNQAYRDRLEQESKHNVEFFVRFVALLLNDVTYVLDNSLTSLGEINRLQKELEAENSDLTADQRTEKERALSKAEKDATSYTSLGNETVAMLKLFTSAIGDAFIQPEIVSRLASMLNYNLEVLVGPRCGSLKVQNPEKYRFNPRQLLCEIVDVYLNLHTKQPFIEAIARDGRSYRPELFDQALSRLKNNSFKSSEEIRDVAKLAQDVKEAKRKDDEGELELGDIPDEFLDPLMFTLMEDPVILPSSRVTIDRQTIKSHLLSDATDPFNRAPLRIEEVQPDIVMKEKIDTWIKERRSAVRHEPDTMEIDP